MCSSSTTPSNASPRSWPLESRCSRHQFPRRPARGQGRAVRHDHGVQVRRAARPTAGGSAAAAHSDRVDHHVVTPRSIDDVRLARRTLAKLIGPLSLPSLSTRITLRRSSSSPNASHRLIDRAPERRRRVGMISYGSAALSSRAVARKGRADRDLASEGPDAGDVVFRRRAKSCTAPRAGGHDCPPCFPTRRASR